VSENLTTEEPSERGKSRQKIPVDDLLDDPVAYEAYKESLAYEAKKINKERKQAKYVADQLAQQRLEDKVKFGSLVNGNKIIDANDVEYQDVLNKLSESMSGNKNQINNNGTNTNTNASTDTISNTNKEVKNMKAIHNTKDNTTTESNNVNNNDNENITQSDTVEENEMVNNEMMNQMNDITNMSESEINAFVDSLDMDSMGLGDIENLSDEEIEQKLNLLLDKNGSGDDNIDFKSLFDSLGGNVQKKSAQEDKNCKMNKTHTKEENLKIDNTKSHNKQIKSNDSKHSSKINTHRVDAKYVDTLTTDSHESMNMATTKNIHDKSRLFDDVEEEITANVNTEKNNEYSNISGSSGRKISRKLPSRRRVRSTENNGNEHDVDNSEINTGINNIYGSLSQNSSQNEKKNNRIGKLDFSVKVKESTNALSLFGMF
jgi:hypothetical protein